MMIKPKHMIVGCIFAVPVLVELGQLAIMYAVPPHAWAAFGNMFLAWQQGPFWLFAGKLMLIGVVVTGVTMLVVGVTRYVVMQIFHKTAVKELVDVLQEHWTIGTEEALRVSDWSRIHPKTFGTIMFLDGAAETLKQNGMRLRALSVRMILDDACATLATREEAMKTAVEAFGLNEPEEII